MYKRQAWYCINSTAVRRGGPKKARRLAVGKVHAVLGFRSVRAQGGDILSLTGTEMFWLKHWVGQATSVSRSAAQTVFEREHLQGR